MKIEYIQKCKCGAVTIRFDNGASNRYYCEAEFLSRLVTVKYKRYEQFRNRYSR